MASQNEIPYPESMVSASSPKRDRRGSMTVVDDGSTESYSRTADSTVPLEYEAHDDQGDSSVEDQQSANTYARIATEDDNVSEIAYQRKPVSKWTILTDCAVVILPLMILSFLLVVSRLDGSDSDATSYQSWQDGITLLGTMFSILFASVVGRLMSEYARWKLERGATLGSLEQLMGSRTVGGTIQTWFHFPTFLGSGLVLLWAFSPLGAQAILRILSSQPHPNVTPTNITYYNSLASNRFSSLRVRDRSDLNTAGNVVSYFSTLYNAVITMPPTIKQDAMDLWGNVKIPILSDAASNDWQHTTEVVGEIHYSALVGVPIRHNDLGNTTFSLESSYMFLECPNITRVDGPSSIQFQAIRSDDLWTAARIGNVHDDEYVPGPPNGTWHGYPKERNGSQTTNIGVGEGNASWAIALDTFVDSFWSNESIQTKRLQEDYGLHERSPVQGSPALFENETDIEVHPARLLVQLQFPGDYAMNQPPPRMEATCNVSQRYVESKSISHLSFPRTFAYISQYLPTMASNEMSVYYLQDPNFVNMSGSGISGKPLATLDGVEDGTIGIRLSQLLNTYLAIAQLSAAVAGE
ncbi:hypothetical protein CcaCcLH18_03504 [Colletotrichum camelliae]|nr:hypothetical protein CcaCcLH18_03504 [Colletotrichum camelliae]